MTFSLPSPSPWSMLKLPIMRVKTDLLWGKVKFLVQLIQFIISDPFLKYKCSLFDIDFHSPPSRRKHARSLEPLATNPVYF